MAQAWLIATAVSQVATRDGGRAGTRTLLALLLLVIVCRAAVAWLGELLSVRASASAKSDLRCALVERVAILGPRGDRGRSKGRLAVLASSGVDALDSYFARFLPQIVLAVLVPLAVTVIVSGVDWSRR